MAEITFGFPSVFRQGVPFPCGQVQSAGSGALVRKDCLYFVFVTIYFSLFLSHFHPATLDLIFTSSSHHPTVLSPHHLAVSSPCHPTTSPPHHLITSLPCHLVTPSPCPRPCPSSSSSPCPCPHLVLVLALSLSLSSPRLISYL